MNVARHLIAISVLFVLAACGGSTPSATPKPIPSTTGSIPATTSSDAPSSGPKTGQTDTEWGRIWDSLPAGFPAYPGSTPDETGAGGPSSAVFVVDGLDAKDAATFFETILKRAGWTTQELSDPLEDGSVTLDMTGTTDGCALRVTAKPTGNLTTMTVLYGAGCPNG